MIPFGEFAPDQADYNKDVATQALNVMVGAGCYLPIRSASTVVNTITGESNNFIAGVFDGSPVAMFINDGLTGTNKLYIGSNDRTNGTWPDFVFDQLTWPFVEWDETLLIAGSGCVPQKWTSGDAASSDIGGSPPVAFTSARVRDFLVLGGTQESGTTYKNRVKWSGFDNYEQWVVGTNQSDIQDLQSSSQIQRIIGGEYGLIFQQDGTITRMTYVGSPVIFQFDEIEKEHGALNGLSVVKVGNDVYYLSKNGFRVIRDGARSEPIGEGKIDKWFSGKTNGYQTQTIAAYDEQANTVFWTLVYGGTTATQVQAIYNITYNKWTNSDLIIRCPISIRLTDGEEFKNALHIVKADGADIKVYRMDGATLSATVETGEFADGNNRTQLNSVRPIIDGTCTVTVDTRDLLTDAVSSSSATSLDSYGKANFKTNNRYHRIKCTTSGDFTQAVGVEIDAKKRGKR